MSAGPSAVFLPDGRRLHLNHGPIDLIIEAWGKGRRQAYSRAVQRFQTVLDELATELSVLRRHHIGISSVSDVATGPVARRMVSAVGPYCEAQFVTPMAAVAGSVADEILGVLCDVPGIDKAYVNNGGDVAVHLSADHVFDAAIAGKARGEFPASVRLSTQMPWRGVATSGWRGRSHSLGIADSVTVLAYNAASADVAATLIANAVDLPGHSGIVRVRANELSPDSDLGERLVTVEVPSLAPQQIETALSRGVCRARELQTQNMIGPVFLTLQGHSATSDIKELSHA